MSQRDLSATESPGKSIAERFRDFLEHRVRNSAVFAGLFPIGTEAGRFVSRLIALPQLKALVQGPIPWHPPSKPLAECTVALVSSGGVHLRTDQPFHLNGDPTFRVIPKTATQDELSISHQAYDTRDALQDLNLVFPLERLRELELQGVVGRLAEEHYGFGLMGSAKRLMPSIKDVAHRIKASGVDLALLVPA
jgi:D-proline reductase (dithiol) PrdB